MWQGMYEVTALISSVPTKPVLVMPTKFPIVGLLTAVPTSG
jgi:hypothetical protein